MDKIILECFDEYNKIMSAKVPDYWEFYGFRTRRMQCVNMVNSLLGRYQFTSFNVIETGSSSSFLDGAIGIFLGLLAARTGGKMWSVDNNSDAVSKSTEIFKEVIPELNYTCVLGDSVEFLRDFNERVNLIHLDSWDFNLFDPLPSALHGWREFDVIKDKVGQNTTVFVDDNYINGTYLQWNFYNGEISGKTIDLPIIGKGAHVYQWVTSGNKDWELVGNHYQVNDNIKVIVRKK
jgi:hypothetical protein